jgi:hemerythrin-like domain-containing protein
MMPIGPLMAEHRTIERMVLLLQEELESFNSGAAPDYLFLLDAVDFLENFADRCHHGKEEKILFRELSRKRLSPELAGIMAELMAEHTAARENVRRLKAAVQSGLSGVPRLDELRSAAAALAESYPEHILKEDKRFFIPCMSYFDEAEQKAMLVEMEETETRLLHDIYHDMVKQYEV